MTKHSLKIKGKTFVIVKSYIYFKVINTINIYWQLQYVLKSLEYLCKRLYYGNEKNKAADEKKQFLSQN